MLECSFWAMEWDAHAYNERSLFSAFPDFPCLTLERVIYGAAFLSTGLTVDTP